MDDRKNFNNNDNNRTRVFGMNDFGFEERPRPENLPAQKHTPGASVPNRAAPASVPAQPAAPVVPPQPAVSPEDAATLDPAELARRFDALGEEYRVQKAQEPPGKPPVNDLEAEFIRMHSPAVKKEEKLSTDFIDKVLKEKPDPLPETHAAKTDALTAEDSIAELAGRRQMQRAVEKKEPQRGAGDAGARAAGNNNRSESSSRNGGSGNSNSRGGSSNRNGGNRSGDGNNRSESSSRNGGNRSGGNRSGDGSSRGGSSNRSGGGNARNAGGNARNNNSNRRNVNNAKNRKKKKKESIAAKIFKGLISAIVIIIIAFAVIGTVYVYGIVKDMPRYKDLDFVASLKVMSTMYDDQGTPMKNIYLPEGQRILATYDQVPQDLIDALVAIEDKTFWTHKGFNIIRIGGAILESWRGGGGISGTSTITQQLARNIWLIDERDERTAERKIKEAFYARELEKNLTKEEILMAYLNTIALGNHSYGILAAAENYYGKRLEDLDLLECAALAALPKAPSEYSMIQTVTPGDVESDDNRILLAGSQYTYLYNDKIEPRLKLVLSEMYDQGYISKGKFDLVLKQQIRHRLHPKELEADSNADFFVSYAIDCLADDLLKHDPGLLSRDEAIQKIYSGGLDIYTTFNQRAQDIATEEFENPENFPKPDFRDLDQNGNLLDDSKAKILLFKYEYMFEERGDGPWFHLMYSEDETKTDYMLRADGSMVIFGGAAKRLGIYQTNGPGGPDINLEFKDYYSTPDGVMYITKGGYIEIPVEFKSVDGDGNLILSREYMRSPDNIFTKDEEGELWIGPKHFTLRQEVLQPQSAFILIDHRTGQVKAMVGGRGIKGQFQFNRTLAPRPPGSTIKPIGVYGPALEMSANGEMVGGSIPTYGNYWSPLSIIIDEEMKYKDKVWPRNWYPGFRGPTTLRKSIEDSMNINAVKVLLAVGDQRSVTFLKKLGITTLVEEGGISDLAPGALALGGMTKGLTPLEIASAYGTFSNSGVHVAPITYTLVRDKHGNVLLDGTPESTQAMDPGAAFIMNDMLRTTVSNGIATNARVAGTQIAGKTGTTSDYYDAWFVGNTPKYSASVWIGCDIAVRLTAGSAAAAKLFSTVMTRIIEGEDQGEYPPQPENVVSATVSTKPSSNPEKAKTYTDYFIVGTVPQYIDLGVEELEICSETGYLATPWCPVTELKEYSTIKQVSEDEDYENTGPPEFYCHMHNLDPQSFPPNPYEEFNSNFGKAEVPVLVGLTIEEALDLLTGINLRLGDIFTNPGAFTPKPGDLIISQNPPPGAYINEGATINITVEEAPAPPPPPVVPPVVPPVNPGPGNQSTITGQAAAVMAHRLNPVLFSVVYYIGQAFTVAS